DSEPAADRRRSAATTTTEAAATTSAPPETAPPDPATCLGGSYRLANQEYSGPVETVYGPAMLEGGEAGRTIELRADGTFSFNDTGAEDTKFSLTAANPPITGTAKLVADAGGAYTATATTVTVDVTTLSGTLTATTSDGQVIDVPLPPDAAGVEQTFGFTPDATYTCDGDGVTVQFQVLTLVLDRQ
ncbi:MAG TPA: hypothetical protein VMQ81_04460, partial [Acidimicrobiia bacterium]|nr:hypothetical protein [Acidimicrobiia bacterium]